MLVLRTRMLVHQISTLRDDDGNIVQQDINFKATPTEKNPENKSWTNDGAGASFSITVTNAAAFGFFDKVNEVFFDINTTDTPVPMPVVIAADPANPVSKG